MSYTIPNLKLFPLYTGGPILNGKNGLNANSSFVIPATKFTPAYAVNQAPSTNTFDANNFLTFGPDKAHRLVSKPISQATDYTTMLGINTSVPGRISTVSAPTTAPEIPDMYKNMVELYNISDLKFSDLMAQAEFRIPTIGMGLKVTTDGNGGVDSITLDPSSRGTMARANAVGHSLGSPNRAAISIAATYKVNDPGFSFGDVYAVESPTGPPKTAATNNLPADPLALQANGLGKNSGIFNVGLQAGAGVNGLDGLGAGPDGINPVLARLNQLQPQDFGLALSGADAEVSATQAQQVAVSQADLGVNLSDNFYQNMASVVSAANNQRQDSYAANFAPPRVERLMDGRVNVQPWQLPPSANRDAAAVSSGLNFDIGASVADATAGSSKNAYMPFNMQSETSGGGGGSGFANPNPFSHSGGMQGGMQSGSGGGQSSGQQLPYYRKPLAYSA